MSPVAVEGLSEIAMRALSTDPGDRFRHVGALRDALEEWESRSLSRELSTQARKKLSEVEAGGRQSSVAYAQVLALANASLEKWSDNGEASRVHERATVELKAFGRRSTTVLRSLLMLVCAILTGVAVASLFWALWAVLRGTEPAAILWLPYCITIPAGVAAVFCGMAIATRR